MSISTWIRSNIVGQGGDYGKSVARQIPTGPDADEQAIKQGLDQIKDKVDELRAPVQPSVQGGYDDLSARDKLVLGGSAGAVVGGALGAAKGLLGASAPFTVGAQWETHQIMQPSLSFDTSKLQVPGITQMSTANGLQDITVPNAAIRYHFEPKIDEKQVGAYLTPAKFEEHNAFTTNSLAGAAEGAAVGALGGVALTTGYIVLQHLRGADGPSKTSDNVSYGNEKRTIAKTAAAGAAIGGAVGALDGALEHARAGAVQTVTWDTPVVQHQTIGQVPQDASIIIRSDVRYDQHAFDGSKVFDSPSKFNLDAYLKSGPKVDVQADVPQKHLLGGFQMNHHSQSFTSEARYGIGTTIVGGIVLGGLIGVAAGVAANVIRKIVDA